MSRSRRQHRFPDRGLREGKGTTTGQSSVSEGDDHRDSEGKPEKKATLASTEKVIRKPSEEHETTKTSSVEVTREKKNESVGAALSGQLGTSGLGETQGLGGLKKGSFSGGIVGSPLTGGLGLAGPPQVRAGLPQVSSSYSKKAIRSVVSRHLGQVRHCYERSLKTKAPGQNRITTTFVISKNGSVKTSNTTSQFKNEALSRCVSKTIRAMKFPAPPGGREVTVSYPFHFSKGRSAAGSLAGYGGINILGSNGSGIGHGFGRGSARGGLGALRPPKVRVGQATVGPSFPKEIIRRVIRTKLKTIRYCYESSLKTKPNRQGRITVKFVIDKTGSVKSLSTSSDMKDQSLVLCVSRAVESMKFPAPKGGGSIVVSYPFVFQSSK